MRCKACNTELDMLTFRHIELENGHVLKVEEDLCTKCRHAAVMSYVEGFDNWSDLASDLTKRDKDNEY